MLRSDIAFKSGINRCFLPLMTAFMVFLACLTLATATTGNSLASDWSGRLAGNLTIQVLPDAKAKNPGREIEDRIKGVISILKETPGISSASAMSLAETRELLRPWLGDLGAGGLDITLPRLVSIQSSGVIPLDAKALADRLRAYSPLVSVDAYGDWVGEFRRILRAAQTLLGLIILLILAASGMAVAYATKAGLIANRNVVEIMHMVGAEDGYIARKFSYRMAGLASMGGLAGFAAAAFAVLAIQRFAPAIEGGIAADLEFSPFVYLYMLAIPAAAALIAEVAALLSIKGELDRMV